MISTIYLVFKHITQRGVYWFYPPVPHPMHPYFLCLTGSAVNKLGRMLKCKLLTDIANTCVTNYPDILFWVGGSMQEDSQDTMFC